MSRESLVQPGAPTKWFELPVFRQVAGAVWFLLWVICLLALFSYDPYDLSFSAYPPNTIPSNFIGWFGACLAWSLYWGAGFASYLLCVLFFWFFLVNIIGLEVRWRFKPIYVVFFMASACCLLNLQTYFGWDVIERQANVDSPGGLLGATIIDLTVPYLLNKSGAEITFGAIFFLSTLLLFDLNPVTTTLNLVAWFRTWRERAEEAAYLRATDEERLQMQHRMLKKKEQETLEALRQAAASGEAAVRALKAEAARTPARPITQSLPIVSQEPSVKTRPPTQSLPIISTQEPAPAPAVRTRPPTQSLPIMSTLEPVGNANTPTPTVRTRPPTQSLPIMSIQEPAPATSSIKNRPATQALPVMQDPAPTPALASIATPEPVAPGTELTPAPVTLPAARSRTQNLRKSKQAAAAAAAALAANQPSPTLEAPVVAEPETVSIPVPAIDVAPAFTTSELAAEPMVSEPFPQNELESTPAPAIAPEPVAEVRFQPAPEPVPVESPDEPVFQTQPKTPAFTEEMDARFLALQAVEKWVAEPMPPEPVLEPVVGPVEPEPTAPDPVQRIPLITRDPFSTMPIPEVEAEPLAPVVEPEPEPALAAVPFVAPEPAAPLPKRSVINAMPAPEPRPPQPVQVLSSDPNSTYQLPSVDLLTQPDRSRNQGLTDDQLRENLDLIVKTLGLFGVLAAPGDITPGATITRYEVYPAAGVRVDKISSLSKDLSRVLCAERINILAPIPGKDSVGIEVPNSNKVAVFLRELLESRDWHATTAKIPIALGKDVYGKTLVADLGAMPHMLIGGTTGSGKSVCINCILMSFLYKFSPEDLRLILIDPKQVEMQVYNAIPHLVVPVVTEPKKVLLALKWVINEMEKRYRILAKVGVRNIATFNSRKREAIRPAEVQPAQLELMGLDEREEDEDDEDSGPAVAQVVNVRVPREDDLIIPDKMPYIVVIIDELADLMQTAPADVENAIARLTAKARAAGIHLIVATQTPRREVVTGVIKTNIPSRIAFQVPSGLDSRVILDENGAENLLGRGDLMYKPPGVGRLIRGQGAFVSDEEVQAVVKLCGDQAAAVFNEEIHTKLSGRTTEDISEEDQKLIIDCFEVIRQEKKASTSNLQRRLRLGYNRAAYVIDYLERIGVVGPGDGAKPREILVDLDNYFIEF